MVFADLDFVLVFLPIVTGLYALSERYGPRTLSLVVLGVSSLVFYAIGSLPHLFLLAGLTAINYQVGTHLPAKARTRRVAMIAAVSLNLLILFYFKYTAFFLQNLLPAFNGSWSVPIFLQNTVLPLGISYYTFQQIGFLLDCARDGPPRPAFNLPRYFLFMFFFPQLVAGPIMHIKKLVPQFDLRRSLADRSVLRNYGLMIFAVGLGKKLLIADPLTPYVRSAFDIPEALSLSQAWTGLLAYTLQLYFDFSGYSDMAVGLGALLGFRIPNNFKRPYLSTNVQEFWRRWHITLSFYLRQYLYIPMGGNRGNALKVSSRLMITMLLGGLWHGAGWTFVLWGGYHGALLCIHRWWRRLGMGCPRGFAWPITLVSVSVGWVFFRSESLADAAHYLKALLGLGSGTAVLIEIPLQLAIGALLLITWNERLPWRGRWAKSGGCACGMLLFWSISNGGQFSEFLYFRF